MYEIHSIERDHIAVSVTATSADDALMKAEAFSRDGPIRITRDGADITMEQLRREGGRLDVSQRARSIVDQVTRDD